MIKNFIALPSAIFYFHEKNINRHNKGNRIGNDDGPGIENNPIHNPEENPKADEDEHQQ